MAEVNVENIEDLMALFEEKMGFSADADGLVMTEEQVVNFMLLCHQAEYGMMDEEEGEEYEEGEEMEEHGDSKIKVIKVKGGDIGSVMDEILSHSSPRMMGR
tara:strand:- start:5 stop:310 length:306 start_codon:yes stop_codon:yes gene_type:complete